MKIHFIWIHVHFQSFAEKYCTAVKEVKIKIVFLQNALTKIIYHIVNKELLFEMFPIVAYSWNCRFIPLVAYFQLPKLAQTQIIRFQRPTIKLPKFRKKTLVIGY